MRTHTILAVCLLATVIAGTEAGLPTRSLLTTPPPQCSYLDKCLIRTCQPDGYVSISLKQSCIKSSGTIGSIRLVAGDPKDLKNGKCLIDKELDGKAFGTWTSPSDLKLKCGTPLTLIMHDASFHTVTGSGKCGAVGGTYALHPVAPTQLPSGNPMQNQFCKFTTTAGKCACETECATTDKCKISRPLGCGCNVKDKMCYVTLSVDKPKACPGTTVTYTAKTSGAGCDGIAPKLYVDGYSTGYEMVAKADCNSEYTYTYTIPSKARCGSSISAQAKLCGGASNSASYTVGGCFNKLSDSYDNTATCTKDTYSAKFTLPKFKTECGYDTLKAPAITKIEKKNGASWDDVTSYYKSIGDDITFTACGVYKLTGTKQGCGSEDYYQEVTVKETFTASEDLSQLQVKSTTCGSSVELPTFYSTCSASKPTITYTVYKCDSDYYTNCVSQGTIPSCKYTPTTCGYYKVLAKVNGACGCIEEPVLVAKVSVTDKFTQCYEGSSDTLTCYGGGAKYYLPTFKSSCDVPSTDKAPTVLSIKKQGEHGWDACTDYTVETEPMTKKMYIQFTKCGVYKIEGKKQGCGSEDYCQTVAIKEAFTPSEDLDKMTVKYAVCKDSVSFPYYTSTCSNAAPTTTYKIYKCDKDFDKCDSKPVYTSASYTYQFPLCGSYKVTATVKGACQCAETEVTVAKVVVKDQFEQATAGSASPLTCNQGYAKFYLPTFSSSCSGATPTYPIITKIEKLNRPKRVEGADAVVSKDMKADSADVYNDVTSDCKSDTDKETAGSYVVLPKCGKYKITGYKQGCCSEPYYTEVTVEEQLLPSETLPKVVSDAYCNAPVTFPTYKSSCANADPSVTYKVYKCNADCSECETDAIKVLYSNVYAFPVCGSYKVTATVKGACQCNEQEVIVAKVTVKPTFMQVPKEHKISGSYGKPLEICPGSCADLPQYKVCAKPAASKAISIAVTKCDSKGASSEEVVYTGYTVKTDKDGMPMAVVFDSYACGYYKIKVTVAGCYDSKDYSYVVKVTDGGFQWTKDSDDSCKSIYYSTQCKSKQTALWKNPEVMPYVTAKAGCCPTIDFTQTASVDVCLDAYIQTKVQTKSYSLVPNPMMPKDEDGYASKDMKAAVKP